MVTFSIFLLFAFTFFVVFAIICDLLTYQIPNWVSISLSGLFLVYFCASAMSGLPLMPFLSGFGCGVFILLVGFTLFALNVIGGGDAKFTAVIAMWLGWGLILHYLFLATLLGGVLTVGIFCFRQLVIPLSLLKANFIMRLYSKDEGVPYGIALGSAALVMIYEMPIFQMALMGLFG